MTTLNWEKLEKSFQSRYNKTQEKMAIVRQNLLNRKIDEAIEGLKEILSFAPKSIEAQNLLTYCLKEKGEDIEETKRILEETLQFDPKNILTNFHLAEIYYKQQDYQNAIKCYLTASSALPSNAKLLYQIGLTYQKLKNFKDACEYYEKAIVADPKFRKPYINACILFDKFDDHARMMDLMGELETNFNQSSKALNVTNVLYNNFPEKNVEIEKNFKQVSSIDPHNLLNLYNQAVYHHGHNDLDRACHLFTKIMEDSSLKNIKTHPLKIFSQLQVSLILERQAQLKNARKILIDVVDDLNGFMNPQDVNNKINDIQKLLTKKRSSHRSSFLVADSELMGAKDLMNIDNEASAINREEESDFNTTQSDMRPSMIQTSKRNSKFQQEARITARLWDKETCLKHLEEDPTNYEVNLRLGVLHMEDKELEEADKKFKVCLEICPEEERNKLYVLLSEVNRLLKHHIWALEYLEKVTDIDMNVEALTAKAACEEKTAHADEAKSDYQKALNLPNEYAPLYRRYGWFLIKLGDVREGTRHLNRASELDPKDIKIHKKLGRAYLLAEENKLEDAFHSFNIVHQNNPDDYIGLLGLGQAYERKGNYKQAQEYLEKAAEHNKADINCQFFLGTVYSKLRDFKKAQEIFRNVLKQDPNHVEACVEIGTILTLLKDYNKAKKYFRHAIKNNPENIIANIRYGKICQVYLKDFESAMECYQRILSVDSNHYKSYYQMGLIFYEQKKQSEAHEYFKTALKANPKYAPAWKAIGILLFESNKIESALKYFERAASYEPRDVETKIYIGNCYYELQNNDKAIEVYLDVLQLEESADIYYNLANSYYMKSDLDNAIEHYTSSIRLNPNRAECWYNLGNAYCMQGLYDDAVTNFKKSIDIDNQNVAAYYNLGNAYLLLKNLKQAIRAFEEALRLDPNNTDWKMMLAGIYLEDADFDNVFRLVKEVLAKDPNKLDAMMLLVQSYEGNGDYQEAMKTAKKIHLMKPNYEGIQEKMAQLSEKIN